MASDAAGSLGEVFALLRGALPERRGCTGDKGAREREPVRQRQR
jgi:hypothetical protein